MTRRHLLTLLAVTAGLLVSGCGQEMYQGAGVKDEPTTAVSPTPHAGTSTSAPSARSVAAVAQAGEATREAGSSRLAMTVEAAGGGDSFSVDARGLFDYRRGVGRMEMVVPGLAEPVQQIITPDAIYLKMTAPGAPAGWVRVGTAGAGGAGGAGLGGNDPSAVLAAIQGVSDDVSRRGRDVVRGVRTTRYAGTLDLRKALARAPEQQRVKVQEALRRLRVSTVPFVAYVDGDGLLRRLVQTMTMNVPGTGTVDLKLTLDLYDFGVKVQVSPPPPGQVTDQPTLGPALGG